jgi:hypothetical protein
VVFERLASHETCRLVSETFALSPYPAAFISIENAKPLFLVGEALVVSVGGGQGAVLVALRPCLRACGGIDAQYMDAGRDPDLLGDSGSLIRKGIGFGRHGLGLRKVRDQLSKINTV